MFIIRALMGLSLIVPTNNAFPQNMHCQYEQVNSIAGAYCQTAMPNPYLDSDV
jgi:hypothetical protein